jgi:hypothetical protein
MAKKAAKQAKMAAPAYSDKQPNPNYYSEVNTMMLMPASAWEKMGKEEEKNLTLSNSPIFLNPPSPPVWGDIEKYLPPLDFTFTASSSFCSDPLCPLCLGKKAKKE